MPSQITGERLNSLFRPRSVALVGASDKSAFSWIAYRNLVGSGLGEHTYLVSRRGTETHGQPTVTSCTQIGEPVDVAYMMVPQAGLLAALDDAAAAGSPTGACCRPVTPRRATPAAPPRPNSPGMRTPSAWSCSARTISASPTSPTAVLDGVRGAAPADRDALTAVIARIGDLALALADDLESLEVNPLLVDGTRIEALDAVVTWREHS